MLFDEKFRRPDGIQRLVKELWDISQETGPIRLMEICGTHTMAIAKAGLRSLLPPSIQLLSGPGCPVCVTPAGAIDEILRLSGLPDVILASYGDLLRVPGSVRGDTLLRRRALGAQVQTVYSPMEALEIAVQHPDQEVIFLGVGFETTAPGTAACILEAKEQGASNFSVLCLLKSTEPALRALIHAPDFAVDGFLCPGHVAVITGSKPLTCSFPSTVWQRCCGKRRPPWKMNIRAWFVRREIPPRSRLWSGYSFPQTAFGEAWEPSRTAALPSGRRSPRGMLQKSSAFLHLPRWNLRAVSAAK